MSGVAKDDSNPSSPNETVTPGAPGQPASHESSSFQEEVRARRAAPHLRVVGEQDDFIPPELPTDGPSQRIGALLRARRESLGYSLDQVSKDTRVHLSHLRAIEDMTPGLLGAPVYAKGYIRSYARYLGLDEMSTLERYLSECAILKDPAKHDIAPPATGRSLPVAVPILGFLVVALVGAAAAFFFMNGDKPTATAAAPAAKASPAPPAAAGVTGVVAETAPSAPAQILRVVALRTARLEVRAADGTKMVARDYYAGESYLPRVGAQWTVSSNDGQAFEWRLGDQSLGLLGDAPGPIYSQSVDIAAKRPPVVIAPPVLTDAEKAAAAAAANPSATPAPPPAATANGATANGAAGNTPAPVKPPRPARPKIETLPAAKPAAPPAATANTQPPAAPAQTPTKDPALAAYPDQ